jgi:hypothetical protein
MTVLRPSYGVKTSLTRFLLDLSAGHPPQNLEAIFHTIFKPAEEEAIRKKSEDKAKKIVKKRVSKKATKIVKQDDGHNVDKDQVAPGRARFKDLEKLKQF